MSVFDKYLLKKDKLLRRRIEIDNSLYEKLISLSFVILINLLPSH